jgi:RimJ/RimL family protein N-acetyltransferase
MTEFSPGQILKKFSTKSNKEAVLRIMDYDDVNKLYSYINKLSAERTYIVYNGEKVTLAEEKKFVTTSLEKMEKGDKVPLVCEVDGQIASNCSVERNMTAYSRCSHIGVVGMSVAKNFRNDGIGFKCMEELIILSRKLKGIRMLQLDVFSENKPAIDLYRKAGFHEVARLPRQYSHQNKYLDGIVMLLDL